MQVPGLEMTGENERPIIDSESDRGARERKLLNVEPVKQKFWRLSTPPTPHGALTNTGYLFDDARHVSI
jgi:hypothetical protein